tara:strand:+ start:284 stop:1141 length:858 start_codon:yes stop_codon:yes gene_type:complete
MRSSTLSKYKDLQYPSFKYEKVEVCGVGKGRLPFVDMDEYYDTNLNSSLYSECLVGLSLCSFKDFKFGNIVGGIPPYEKKTYGDNDSWTETLDNIMYLDPTGIHRNNIDTILSKSDDAFMAVQRYISMAMGATIPWYFACHLYSNTFQNKGIATGTYTDAIRHFPNLLSFIKTLPFKEVGRIMFFTTYPNGGVVTHRDNTKEAHKDHSINFFFKTGRPSFIWDPINEKKIYLDKDVSSYYFNNRDYHGVDPEPTFQFTLRVDGTFEDYVQQELGLEDGYTWKSEY